MPPAPVARAKPVWEQIAGWMADMFEVAGPLEVSHELFLPLLQVWEAGILLRALRPEEHGSKKAVPSGKTGWVGGGGGCYPKPFSSDLLFS